MGTVVIRQAVPDDAPGIAKVLVDGWNATYTGILPASFLHSFTYPSHEISTRLHLTRLPLTSAVFVAVDADEIVGVAAVGNAQSVPEGFTAELDALYVLPTRQREGIGKQLMIDATKWLVRRGHQNCALWVLRANPYREFYTKMGAEVVGDGEQTFGDQAVPVVACGWSDLPKLVASLEAAL